VLEADKPSCVLTRCGAASRCVSLSGLDCGCSRPAPAALDGCGCKYSGASLSQSPVDLDWHSFAVLGSVAGAFVVWLLAKRKR